MEPAKEHAKEKSSNSFPRLASLASRGNESYFYFLHVPLWAPYTRMRGYMHENTM